MKANRLNKEYENEMIKFLEFAEKTFLMIIGFFGALVKIVEIHKNVQGMLYSII